MYDHPGLYWAAMDACHSVGLPWTDPRTGQIYHPDRCRGPSCKRKHAKRRDTGARGKRAEVSRSGAGVN